MLQKFFFSLYKALIGFFGQGQPTVLGLADYRARVFLPVGLWTLVMAAGLVMIFYYVVNGEKSPLKGKQWNSPWRWWATLLLAAGVGAQLAYYGVYKADPQAVSEAYCRSFIYVNAMVASLWFFLLSLIPNLAIPHKYKNTDARNRPFPM